MSQSHRHTDALTILTEYQRSLVARIADEIVAQRDAFQADDSVKPAEIVDRWATHLQNLRCVQGELLSAMSTGKPPAPNEGYPVGPDTFLEPGMQVLCDWSGVPWTAEILEIEGDDEIRIHYVEWGSEWDETVPRSRLQLIPEA